MDKPAKQRELVVLTHGIASSKWMLLPLARRLRRQGFAARLWGYPTLFRPIEDHGRTLAELVRRLTDHGSSGAGGGGWDRVHLVVHSMGSIVARCALRELEQEPPDRLGRIVMIGPPNGGSHMATFLTPVYGWFSKSLVQLRDTPESFVNNLPAPPNWAEIGVLAATRDNVIHLDRTHLAGQRDHRVVEGWHTGLLWEEETAELTASFLKTGRFAEQKTPVDTPIEASIEAFDSLRRSGVDHAAAAPAEA